MTDATDRCISGFWLLIVTKVLIVVVIVIVFAIHGCDDGRDPDRPKPPPAPFFTSNAGQKWVKIPAHDLEWWLEKHPAAIVVSMSARDYVHYLIVYEEIGDE